MKSYTPPYQIVHLVQRSEPWYSFRKGKIGASDIPAIMNTSPFETRLQCWERMIFDKQKEVTPSMQRGIDGESEALAWVNDYLSKDSPIFHPAVLQSIKYPWMIASLDGMRHMLGTDHEIEILEIKVPSRQVHMFCKEMRSPPIRYIPQMQFQMYISGVERMLYVSSFDGDIISVVLERDKTYINLMIPQILAFRDCLVNFRPPEASDRDKVVIDDPELGLAAERYLELDRLITELSNERDDIRTRLISNVGHPRAIIGPLSITKVIRPGSVQYADIPELQGVNLLQYRKKPIESWRISYE